MSGAAGLIYELVWFQMLRLTIGGGSQSLGVLLACFMGGLCVGSATYARVVPRRWRALRTYAAMEVAIALCGVGLPALLSAVNAFYLTHASTPESAVVWRIAICVAALALPTILMGATLPALSRWVEADDRQAARIGRLYAANVVGAVAGVMTAALVLLPNLSLVATNGVAVALNVIAAVLALTIRQRRVAANDHAEGDASTADAGLADTAIPERVRAELAALLESASRDQGVVLIAYAVSGAAALSFEVLWTRLLGSVLGATVYGFALVLGVFLLGLALGGWAGSACLARTREPRRLFGLLQLLVAGFTGLTSFLLPIAARLLVQSDLDHAENLVLMTWVNLARVSLVVLPGAIVWGMLFPVAIACLGRAHADAARPVGRLYAWNTVGAVLGSLATSFWLIPHFGSATAAAALVILPLTAGVIIVWPRRVPAWLAMVPAIGVGYIVFATPWPRDAFEYLRPHMILLGDVWKYILLLAPAFIGFELFLVKREPRRLIAGFALTGIAFAFTSAVPAELYKWGRDYGRLTLYGSEDGELVLFEEGAMEPVVVYRSDQGPLEVSINSFVCASTIPSAMEHLRLLGHVPALLSADPRESVVIGLGAGVTAGCLAIDRRVEQVQVVELEPKVREAARAFGESNHHVMDSPKVNVRIDDGRHFIATTPRRFGVITSDPIEPFWSGSAALYTVEHYRRCRERLAPGGVFCQWLGVYGLDEESVRSLLAAFAEAFPEGSVWSTPTEMMFVGTTEPLRFDVEMLRRRIAEDPRVADSLAEVGIRSVEELLGRYVCPVSAMREYLRGVEPNRDRTLIVQYRGWQAFYQPSRWFEQIRQVIARHRRIERERFSVAPGDEARFFGRLDEEWREFLEEKRWPGPVPGDPMTNTRVAPATMPP